MWLWKLYEWTFPVCFPCGPPNIRELTLKFLRKVQRFKFQRKRRKMEEDPVRKAKKGRKRRRSGMARVRDPESQRCSQQMQILDPSTLKTRNLKPWMMLVTPSFQDQLPILFRRFSQRNLQVMHQNYLWDQWRNRSSRNLLLESKLQTLSCHLLAAVTRVIQYLYPKAAPPRGHLHQLPLHHHKVQVPVPPVPPLRAEGSPKCTPHDLFLAERWRAGPKHPKPKPSPCPPVALPMQSIRAPAGKIPRVSRDGIALK